MLADAKPVCLRMLSSAVRGDRRLLVGETVMVSKALASALVGAGFAEEIKKVEKAVKASRVEIRG